MNIWEWIIIALFIVAVVIGRNVLLLELRFKQIENTPVRYRKWLVRHIGRAKNDLRIMSNYLCPCVFNDVVGDITSKLRNNQSFRVEVITGPTIYGDKGENKLYDLIQERSFGERLQHKVASEKVKQDFVIIDLKNVYLCEAHNPTPNPSGLATILENSPSYAQQFVNKFIGMKLEAEENPHVIFKDYDQRRRKTSPV